LDKTALKVAAEENRSEDVDARLARYMEEGGDSIRALTDDCMMNIGDSDKKKKNTSPDRQRTSRLRLHEYALEILRHDHAIATIAVEGG
jgi:hypothetical protein